MLSAAYFAAIITSNMQTNWTMILVHSLCEFFQQEKIYSKCFKISNTILFLFSNKMLIIVTGIHKNAGQNSKQRRPWSDRFSKAVLGLSPPIYNFCTICLDLFRKQLVLETLDHLP